MKLQNREHLIDSVNTMSTFAQFINTVELAKRYNISLNFTETKEGLYVTYENTMRFLIRKSLWKADYYKVRNYCKANFYAVKERST